MVSKETAEAALTNNLEREALIADVAKEVRAQIENEWEDSGDIEERVARIEAIAILGLVFASGVFIGYLIF